MDKHDDETVERVAKAICNSISIDEDDGACACGIDGGTCCAMDLFGVQARAAIAALPQAAVDGWRPIESAPKDGRKALVYRPLARNSGDEPVAIKRLVDTDNTCWECTVPPGAPPCNPTDGSCHVTHWQPLPPAPAQKATGK